MFVVKNMNEWFNTDLPELEFIKTDTHFDKILKGNGLPRRGITTISGYSGNGKSFALMHIAGALTKRYKVLYLSVENAIQVDMQRIKELPERYGANLDNFSYENVAQDNLGYQEILGELGKHLKAGNVDYDAIFIDGADILCGGDTGSEMYSQGNTVMQYLKAVSEGLNCAVVISWQLTRDSEKKTIFDIGTSDIAQSIGVVRYSSLVVAVKKKDREWWLKGTKARFDYDYSPVSVNDSQGRFSLFGTIVDDSVPRSDKVTVEECRQFLESLGSLR